MKTVKTGKELNKVLNEIGELVKEDFVEVLDYVMERTFNEASIRTATATYFLRSNWKIVVDEPPDEKVLYHPGGDDYKAAQYPVLDIKYDSTFVLYNNTEYAEYLEEGTPKSRAQPMIAPSFLLMTSIINKMKSNLDRKVYNV